MLNTFYRFLFILCIALNLAPGLFGQLNPEKLDYPINSDLFDESSPVISMDGRYLYFTRSKYPEFCRALIDNGVDLSMTLDSAAYWKTLKRVYGILEQKPGVNPILSPFNQDIFVVPLHDGEPGFVQHPCFPLNNALPNSVLSAFLDSNTIVVLNQFYRDGSMYEGFSYQKRLEGGEYSFPQPLHIYDFYTLSADVNLALSYDGDVMILSLKREDSKGKNDLYVSFRVKDGLWSVPKNMGRINTPFQETTPFISKDKRKLYFSSDRSGSIGGNDIFVCERLDYTWVHWTDPSPLMAPINSEYDDAQPFLDHVNSYLYFSSKREGTSDIYRVALKPKPKLKRPIFVSGKILHSETEEPIRAELLWGPESALGYLEYFNTYNGEFEFFIEEFEVYKFLPRKPGFDAQVTRFDARIADKKDDATFEIILYLSPTPEDPDPIVASVEPEIVKSPDIPEADEAEKEPVPAPEIKETPVTKTIKKETQPEGQPTIQEEEFADEPVRTDYPPEPHFKRKQKLSFYNIYFERAKADVRPESYRALNGLVKTLDDNPQMKILIEGHTDNVGEAADLKLLSWQRAEAIRDHLLRYGIPESRIVIYGYGAEKPITDNSTEDLRKRNRRVEIYSVE